MRRTAEKSQSYPRRLLQGLVACMSERRTDLIDLTSVGSSSQRPWLVVQANESDGPVELCAGLLRPKYRIPETFFSFAVPLPAAYKDK